MAGRVALQEWHRNTWRQASFRGAPFHVETGTKESGRRIVAHEFPKKDIPYAEDMGKRAREFTIRGYIIIYPSDRDADNKLKRTNYLPARDELIRVLEQEGPGILQMPLLGNMNVAVQRYRVTEESKIGGYCVFDMTFVEYGKAPGEGSRSSAAVVETKADGLGSMNVQAIDYAINQQQSTGTPAFPA